MPKHVVCGMALLFCLLSACEGRDGQVGTSPGPMSPHLDEWIRFRPQAHALLSAEEDGREVLRAPHHVVNDGMQVKAQEHLLERPFVVLSRESLEEMVGPEAAVESYQGIPVLIRAVRSGPESSGLHAEDRIRVLWMGHDVLVVNEGERESIGLKQGRFAIVAWLPDVPKECYVEDQVSIIGGLPGEL